MMLPLGIMESNEFISTLDQCLIMGFTNLDYPQREALQALGRIYQATPLNSKLPGRMDDLISGIFQPEAFLMLAVARAALQGAQYDSLSRQIREILGRSMVLTSEMRPSPVEKVPPLLDSVRHWLMDIAVAGFSRLDSAMITAFSGTLKQLQANPDYLRTAAVLTGFLNEMLAQPDEIPLFRWCDLWSRAMLTTLTTASTPETQPVSGMLYPLGTLWRQHAHFISMVVYGILTCGDTPELVRITQSTYKVEAIQQEQLWLLFPHITLLLESLSSGKALSLHNMPYLPGGNLPWDDGAATLSSNYKLMEIALKYFAPNANQPINIPALPPEQRHPIHLAEPFALANYQLAGDEANWVVQADGFSYGLDESRVLGSELSIREIESADHLFGLLRFDRGVWLLQPLTVSGGKGKPIFIGKASSKILKKPPKDSTVSILKERASRLLREKA